MNAPTDQSALAPSTELRVVSNEAGALILDKGSIDNMLRVAELMATSKVTIPAHLRNSPGDCMAIVMQAMQWGMNPFSIAQKTHLSQGGALGYEAQLVNAVIVASGALRGQPEFDFIGDWSKILGKVEERKSDKGGKYYVATYSKEAEDGLGVICRATLRGENAPREITVMMSQCYPRFSTQWATDPQQQITYVAVRKFGRRYAPGAILGVYTPEELEESQPREIDITPRGESQEAKRAARAQIETCSDEKFSQNRDAWRKLVESGKKTPASLIATLSTKTAFSDSQKKEIGSWTARSEAPAETKPVDKQTADDFTAGLGDDPYIPE